MKPYIVFRILLLLPAVALLFSCHKKDVKKTEQLTLVEHQQLAGDSTGLSTDSAGMLVTSFQSVLITGIDQVRLIPIYKVHPKADRNLQAYESTTYSEYQEEEGGFKYFLPGMDYIYGYNMVNVAHYDAATDKLSHFFDKPVLVRTLYFPGVKSDSLYNKRVERDFFFVSVYDEDTNRDSLLNKKDLRRFYHIDRMNSRRTLLVPGEFSVIRSSYDARLDVVYIYARQDANGNGTAERNEPMSVFAIRMSEPTVARRIL